MQTASPFQTQTNSAELDALIAKLKRSPVPGSQLLIEHLETAHAYLLGAMPNECCANLNMARTAADTLPDRALQSETRDTVDSILRGMQQQPASAPPLAGHGQPVLNHEPEATANGLAEFFHGADARFGTFYPFQYVVAVFPSFERAEAGQKILHESGLRTGEVLAVPGGEVSEFLEDLRMHRGLGGMLVTMISRFLDTEVVLVDAYLAWARSGAGFLFAYGKTEAAMEHIAELLKPLGPFSMHGFLTGSIRHLDPKY
jgi:hypothetical protein